MGFRRCDHIVGVTITPLKVIEDHRGAVMHMFHAEHPAFKTFGEIYFSKINFGVTKGWKYHQRMTQNFAVPFGQLALTILDDRQHSQTQGHFIHIQLGLPDHYQLVTVAPDLWYAFRSTSEGGTLLANCADMGHDPEESAQKPLEAFLIDSTI